MANIKFEDLRQELRLNRLELSKIRKHKCIEGEDWFKDKEGSWFTEKGADKVRLAHEIPLAVPERVKVRIIGKAPNKRWVWGITVGKGSHRVPVFIPSRLQPDRLVGKLINADVIQDSNGITYRHEAIGKLTR